MFKNLVNITYDGLWKTYYKIDHRTNLLLGRKLKTTLQDEY